MPTIGEIFDNTTIWLCAMLSQEAIEADARLYRGDRRRIRLDRARRFKAIANECERREG